MHKKGYSGLSMIVIQGKGQILWGVCTLMLSSLVFHQYLLT